MTADVSQVAKSLIIRIVLLKIAGAEVISHVASEFQIVHHRDHDLNSVDHPVTVMVGYIYGTSPLVGFCTASEVVVVYRGLAWLISRTARQGWGLGTAAAARPRRPNIYFPRRGRRKIFEICTLPISQKNCSSSFWCECSELSEKLVVRKFRTKEIEVVQRSSSPRWLNEFSPLFCWPMLARASATKKYAALSNLLMFIRRFLCSWLIHKS